MLVAKESNKDNDWFNLSTKSNHSTTAGSFGGGSGGAGSSEPEGDAPLNLSLKSGGDTKTDSAPPGNSLQSLSSITAALGGSSSGAGGKSNDRSGKNLQLWCLLCEESKEALTKDEMGAV